VSVRGSLASPPCYLSTRNVSPFATAGVAGAALEPLTIPR
jgi:hypothetical protein